jgi:hypothetical protein
VAHYFSSSVNGSGAARHIASQSDSMATVQRRGRAMGKGQRRLEGSGGIAKGASRSVGRTNDAQYSVAGGARVGGLICKTSGLGRGGGRVIVNCPPLSPALRSRS